MNCDSVYQSKCSSCSNHNIYLFFGSTGFMKFLGPYYMVIITRRRKVGTICGHDIYSIGKSEMIAIPCPIVWPNVANSRDENRSFIVSLCKYSVLPVVIPSLVPNNIKIASLLPFVFGVLDIDLLFIHLCYLGPNLFQVPQFILLLHCDKTMCIVGGDVYSILFVLFHTAYFQLLF